jgi:AcrR family transcriptional regulator
MLPREAMPQAPRTPRPAGRRGHSRSEKPLSVNPAKPSQRERLRRAMTELTARDGYGEVTVSSVASQAGVSNGTFYEQFADKDECFAAAYRDAAARILGQMRITSRTVERPQAKRAALSFLLEAVANDPPAGWLVFVEGLANRAQMPAERERLMDAYEGAVEEFLDKAPRSEMLADVPAIALVGAVRAIVSRRLRAGAADQLPLLLDDLESWIQSYATPAGETRWSTGPAAILPVAPRPASGVRQMPSATKPSPLPRGRHGLSPAVVARNHRERILYATAEVVHDKGYAEMTVADIVASAGVARDVFYRHFADKHDAFLAAQQDNLYENLAVGAIRFFEGDTWPERMWNVLESITTFVAQQPLVANLRYVEPYAAGPAAIQRLDDVTLNFTFFVAEGYSYRPQARELPHLCSEAISGATFEMIRYEIAHGRASELPRLLPRLTYVAIAPFTGPAEAVALIERIGANRTGEATA